MPILEAVSLTKDYALGEVSIRALAGVSLALEPGAFTAVMGPSGSGKSTLLHLLGGLDRPSSGDVVLDGQSYALLDDDGITRVRRHRVGFVFQFFNLLPILTARENVALPLIIAGRSMTEHAARIQSLLDLVGLAERAHHRPDQLSGGEQQRVSIARALAIDPAIVLADEPTGNLDSRNGLAIMAVLRRTCDELGQTVLMVTHDSTAAAFADEVVFLRDGLVVHRLALSDASPTERRVEIVGVLEALEL